jgi:hypothetical protein
MIERSDKTFYENKEVVTKFDCDPGEPNKIEFS